MALGETLSGLSKKPLKLHNVFELEHVQYLSVSYCLRQSASAHRSVRLND